MISEKCSLFHTEVKPFLEIVQIFIIKYTPLPQPIIAVPPKAFNWVMPLPETETEPISAIEPSPATVVAAEVSKTKQKTRMRNNVKDSEDLI